MTNEQAASKAKKRWPKNFYVRAGQSFSSPERREKATAIVVNARAEIKELEDEITRRLNEVDWYREFRERQKTLRKKISNTEGDAHYYRFNIGKSNGVFNTILGCGDTWEEAFEKTEKTA